MEYHSIKINIIEFFINNLSKRNDIAQFKVNKYAIINFISAQTLYAIPQSINI